ncbi:MAG TPA: urea carboxylase-associated family protein [Candidatus Sulfotelmatobacter sp.]|nr:urea carboxylase-associated family protein [Candidatus Sulfotelmatobacter sp.]
MSDRLVVPAREGRGVRLEAGRKFRCIDLEGRQCGDLFAFSVADVSEYASAEHTRAFNGRLFPRIGEPFVTNRRRPILTYIADASPGRHDMLMAACDPTRYQLLGVEGWHASCQENMRKVMAGFGHDQVEVPQPINVFMDVPVGQDGTLEWRVGPSQPGDTVTFRTELDCYIVLTACAQDILPVNDRNPTSMAIEVLGG